MSDYLKTEIEKHHLSHVPQQAVESASKSDVADLILRVYELETATAASMLRGEQPSSNDSQETASALERRASATDRTLAVLAQRVASLEESVAQPLKVRRLPSRSQVCLHLYYLSAPCACACLFVHHRRLSR